MTKEIQNFKVCQEALDLRDSIEVAFLKLGELLYTIREQELYKGQWETFEEYCMEFRGMSKSTVNKLIAIYEKFVIQFGISSTRLSKVGGWAVLAEALPVVNSKKEAQDWIDRASVLTLVDMRKSVKETQRGIPVGECKHKDTYTIRICRTCGDRERIIEAKLKDLKPIK